MVGINPTERLRLRSADKPTIVKSLVNGAYYCGVDVTQHDTYVAVKWNASRRHSSIGMLVYGKGSTPLKAYSEWRRAKRLSQRRLDAILGR
jgi:hypothetical protein